ncbi:MAG: protein kinase [Deltaproteobacteria bacterium]|nr:protein kinase [Deltaproteobacteria bacterium]
MIDKAQQSGPFGRQDPSLPQVFGRYLLVQRLSRGGMGEIFLAKHGLAGFEKLAVIKKVLPHLAADEQFISRFVDEAQVAIKLQHVNVAQVFEVGRVGDEYFLALEYVEGRDLRRTLALLGHKKTRLPVDLALFIGRELANGLAYAHRRTGPDGSSLNLVHCDISPPNVLVSFEGETKVIDFGIAKSAIRGTATDPKMGFGKFGYMAPEQLIRGGIVDHRTDIYAAGVVLYELLTGQRLYEAGPEPDYRALAKKVARGDHPLPSQHDPELARYDELVVTALRPKVEERYQTAAEFRDAIQQALVAVNPTISTDQLGAYMRGLFHDEMTAQRELNDRIASAHLADFQEQFHTQTISTVSFAMALLPLPPPAPPPPRASRKMTAPQQAIAPPSPALDTVAPPTASMSADDLASLASLADGTGTAVKELEEVAPRRRRMIWPLAAAGGALVLIVVVAFAMRGSSDAKKADDPQLATSAGASVRREDPPPPAPPTKKKNPEIVVEPIDPPTRTAVPPPVKVEAKRPPVQAPPRANPPVATKVEVKKDPPKQPPEVKKDPPASGVTKDQVTNEWIRTTREYNGFKTSNGDRLEREWGDLLVYVQYNMPREANLAETLQRIQAFRQKMR